jgi:spore coat protein CotH
MHLRRDCWLAIALTLTASVSQAQSGGRGFGGVHEDTKILKRYDKDGDGVLNAAERRSALSDFGFDLSQMSQTPVPAAKRLAPAQVRQYTSESLFEPAVVRTVFISFDTPTWEDELAVFKDSDVKIPATVVIDGRTLRDVGVSFRGQTSFRVTSAGQKRSMNLDLNFRHKEQNFLGATRLILLNSAGDPSFLRTVMYMHIARDYYPAFKTNYMRVVINGESWGMYVNQQAADAAFTHAVAGGSSGPIWKVPGSPGGRGGLEYWGDDPAQYQRVFELTHKGDYSATEAWQSLIRLCRTLNETPSERLPVALAPIMDVDGALRFLAVDNALMNSDGYYARASDYNLYIDATGHFHFVAHDVNEVMRPGDGGRRRGRPNMPVAGGNEMSLSPLAGAEQPEKALLNRLLAVTEYKQRYLGYIRDVNNKWLNWERFGAVAIKYQGLIADDVHHDDHKLFSTEAFNSSLNVDTAGGGGMFGATGVSLKTFVEQRHAFLVGAVGEK